MRLAEHLAEHPGRVATGILLAAGQWLGWGEGPFWQPPLYPYFLGAVKVLFPESFFHAARLLQALMGSDTAMGWRRAAIY